MIHFSVELYERQKAAEASEEKARPFFNELEACALEPRGVPSAQALCLLNAKRLARSYPALNSNYENLETKADSSALKLMHDLPL
jgi:hypothetical protein